MAIPPGYPPPNYWTPPPARQANAWTPPGGTYPAGNPANMFNPVVPGASSGPGGGMSPQEMAQLMALAQSMGISPEALGIPGGPGAPSQEKIRGLEMKPDPNNPNSPGTVWDTTNSSGMGFFTKLLLIGLVIGGGVLAFKKWGNTETVSQAGAELKETATSNAKGWFETLKQKIQDLMGNSTKPAEEAVKETAETAAKKAAS